MKANLLPKANRQQLFAKIATGNYDAVIIGHSQLGKIPVSKERQVMTIQTQIDDILQGIEELKKSEGSKFQIKAMERTRKSLQKQLDNPPAISDRIAIPIFIITARYMNIAPRAFNPGSAVSGLDCSSDAEV